MEIKKRTTVEQEARLLVPVGQQVVGGGWVLCEG